MSPRSSVGLIALFLGIFWVLGLIGAIGQTKYDDTRVMPNFVARSDRFAIDKVELARTPLGGTKEDYVFTHADDVWHLKQGTQSIKVEGFHIKEMIVQARGATRDQEVVLDNRLSVYGLEKPQATVTFFGVRKKKVDLDEPKEPADKSKEPAGEKIEWKLFLGKESPDKKFVYVGSSDRPGRVFAVSRSELSSFFFGGPNDLRSKRLFDFNEPIVSGFTIKETAPAVREFEAKKDLAGTWKILKPIQDFADYEGPPTPKLPIPELHETPGGLKGLITSIATLRLDSDDDFIAAAPDNLKRYDLESGKESLRIDITSGNELKPTVDTLLVGKREKDFAYARLGSDEGVFKLRMKYLAPILAALGDPKKYRSVDLAPISIKDADLVTIQHGKDEARFLATASPFPDPKMPDQRTWQIDIAGKRDAVRPKAVDGLLDALQGRRDILAFKDGADGKKLDAELGLDAPTLTVRVYKNAVEAPKKDAANGDPEPRKDAKPEIVWEFGKTEGDAVAVKRTIDAQVDRFTVAKSVLEKILPKEGFLAFLDLAFPRTSVGEVSRIELDRGGKELLLKKTESSWTLGKEKSVSADATKIEQFLREFAAPPVVRWVKTLDPKEDLAAYGLKTPTVKLTFFEKGDSLSPQTIGSALGQLGGVLGNPGLAALGAAVANREADPGAKSVLAIGSRSKDDDAFYATHTGTQRLGLVPAALVQAIESVDLRDPALLLAPAYEVVTALVGNPGPLALSPLATGHLGTADAAAVQEIKLRVRTPVELRTFDFRRDAKGWTDASGLKEFRVDDARVDQAAQFASGPTVVRWIAIAGGPAPEQKLSLDDASLVLEAIGKDGKTTTLTVGAEIPRVGYFAQTSALPGAVFLVPPAQVRPILSGATYFARDRLAAQAE